MKRILVPSDLSEISENALRMAVDIAEKAKADIYLVNFTKHSLGSSFTITGEVEKKHALGDDLFTIQLVRKYHAQLGQLAEKYGSAGHETFYEVHDEDLKDGIDNYVKAKNIDLIVMGTTGEESASEFFSGNHAEQVIEVASCPVITIKSNYAKSNFEHIVLGLSTDKDRHDNFTQAAAYLNDFAKVIGSKVHIVNVTGAGKDKNEIQKKLSAFAEKHGIQNNSIAVVNESDEERGLIDYAKQKSASLLAVFTHAEDSFFRLFSHSVAEELSMESDVPVLTINLHNI